MPGNCAVEVGEAPRRPSPASASTTAALLGVRAQRRRDADLHRHARPGRRLDRVDLGQVLGDARPRARPRRCSPTPRRSSCRSRRRPGRASSTVIAWRFTVNHAALGQPVVAARPRLARVARDVRPPAGRRGSCAATRRCRPSGTPTRCRDRAGAARSGSRCRRRRAACCRRCAPTARRAGPCGRCRSGSAGRGGRAQRVQAHAVRVVAELGLGVGQERRAAQPALSGFQSSPPSVLSNTPPPDSPM